MPLAGFQQVAIGAAMHPQAIGVAISRLFRRDIDAHRKGVSLASQLQQVAVSAADFQQAKAGPIAPHLVEQVIELPLDALFQRGVGRQELAVGQVANPDRFGGMDLLSSLRMPSGVAPLVVLEPDAAALAAAKILALTNADIAQKIASYQTNLRQRAVEDDQSANT